MNMILEYPDGHKEYLDHVWSISSCGLEKSSIRLYKIDKVEKIVTSSGERIKKIYDGDGEEIDLEELTDSDRKIPVFGFYDREIDWKYHCDAGVIYGTIARYLGFTKKARGHTAARAQENLTMKPPTSLEAEEVLYKGLPGAAEWMSDEELYAELPF